MIKNKINNSSLFTVVDLIVLMVFFGILTLISIPNYKKHQKLVLKNDISFGLSESYTTVYTIENLKASSSQPMVKTVSFKSNSARDLSSVPQNDSWIH